MFKKFLLIVGLLLPLTAIAQNHLFGYLSYSQVYKAMPEYAKAQTSMQDLETKYQAEIRNSEEEFNRKYAEYIHGQKDFPQYILEKRQKELQELMEKSIAFKNKTKELLKEAEDSLKSPIMERMNQALKAIGDEFGYAYILNTDNNTYPYINSQAGVDITQTVMNRLGIHQAQ